MSETSIRQHFEEAATLLQEFLENDGNFRRIVEAGNAMAECLSLGGKILSCGNGGSMCDAMHFAEELSGRYRGERPALSALAISDVSHLTCVGNDYGFDSVFARQVEALGRESDILLAISTSGNSPNVLAAAKAATSRGMQVVALTGKNGGALAEACDIEIRVPWSGYSDRIQEIHIKVIHSLIDHIEKALFPGK